MTADEHSKLRHRLGLSAGAEARLLGVSPRTVQRWDSGEQPIPPPVALLLELLELEHDTGPVRPMAVLRARLDADKANAGQPA